MNIAEGVAVVGDSRTTYRNRKQIKAHGATWNKEAQQWQAGAPEAVARLREWFGVSVTPTTEEGDTAHESEPQTTDDNNTQQGEHTHTTANDTAEPSETTTTAEEPTATPATDCNNGTTSDPATPPEDQAQERPEGGAGKPGALDMLRAAAEDVERLTAANDHTAALLARLYVLAAVGLRVRPLVERTKAIEAAQQRGHLTPDEASDRQRISQETERRAALLLIPEEFRTLYGHEPQADSRAA